MQKPVLAAGDIGNSQSKFAYWENGEIQCFSFKSRVKAGAPGLSMLGGKTEKSTVFKLSGEVLSVLENATDPLNIVKEGPDSLAVKALALAGLNQMGLSGREVNLATNLPLGHYVIRDQHGLTAFNDELMDKKMDALRFKDSDTCLSGSEVARIQRGVVFAEGFAAYVDSVVSEQGDVSEPLEKKRGVLDIGGGTTEIGIFGQEFEMDDNFITLSVGTQDILKGLEKRILSRWPDFEKIEPVILDRCMETAAFVDLAGQSHDMSEDITICKREVARKIIQEAKDRLKGNIDYLDQILLVGGGGQMLSEYFSEWQLITVPEAPEFANVRGLLKLITFLSGLDDSEVEREITQVEPLAEVE